MTDEELAAHNVYESYEYTVDYDNEDNAFGEYTPCWRTSDGSIFWDEESAIKFELYWLQQQCADHFRDATKKVGGADHE
jgi:hypothetical protein